jgi:hypothetical protein
MADNYPHYYAVMENNEECTSAEEISNKWIRNNLEEAQQLIDNIVGIKGITEDPHKVAAELESVVILNPPRAYRDNTYTEMYYGWNVIAANTTGTLQREVVDDKKKESLGTSSTTDHEELYGY